MATILESIGIAMLFPILELLINSEMDQNKMPVLISWISTKVTLDQLTILVFTIFTAKALLYFISQEIILNIRINFLNKNTALVNHIISNLKLEKFQTYKPGYFSAILNENIPRVGEALTFYASTISSGITALTLFFFIVVLDINVLLITFAFIIPIWALYKAINTKIAHYSSALNEKKINYTEAIHDLTESHAYSKMINKTKDFEFRKNALAQTYFQILKKINKIHIISQSLREPVILLLLLGIMLGLHVISNSPVSTIVPIIIYLFRCYSNAYNSQIAAQVFLEKVGFLREIQVLQNSYKEDSPKKEKPLFISFNFELKFKNIVLRESRELNPSKQINLTLKPNEFVKISGQSGTGKTTFLSLMALLRKPHSGVFEVDGQRLDFERNIQWDFPVGAVTQDVRLFNSSLRNNLCISKELDVTDNVLIEMLERMKLGYLYTETKEGLDTIIGNGGRILSGGEKQRLLLARELLRQPKLLLLDEPTSALDAESVTCIEEIINTLQGVTVIFITHSPKSKIKFDIELKL
jgi:subfamily B ATP-binding cassette protein MsbA